MSRVLVLGGQMLIFAWALEQPKGSSVYRHQLTFLSEDRQDVLVPWTQGHGNGSQEDPPKRYYHLFRQGELEELVSHCDSLRLVESGYDRDNWYVIVARR